MKKETFEKVSFFILQICSSLKFNNLYATNRASRTLIVVVVSVIHVETVVSVALHPLREVSNPVCI